MYWWKTISESLKDGDVLNTPGIGIDGGIRKRPFAINSIDSAKVVVLSGNAFIKLEKACFDVIEESFENDQNLWLRCASVKANEPLANSADKLIRERTGSQLARGNYVCSILVKSGLVKYSMINNKKGIELP